MQTTASSAGGAPSGEPTRPLGAVIGQLRAIAASIHQRDKRPVSVNDLRDALKKYAPDADPRILGTVFASPIWTAQGFTFSEAPSTSRPVRTFVLT
jgi:hypothetical protein